MTQLEWDKVDQRLYEAGIDHGVLYSLHVESVYNGGYKNGVPWNGLISVEEDFGNDTTYPLYFDGVKYFDGYNNGDFSATIEAFTYPDEFLEVEGVGSLGNGLFVDDQASKLFGMSYRTKIGNVVDGIEHGYQLHLLYNLIVVPEAVNHETYGEDLSPIEFSWSLSAVPEVIANYRPTAHIILDSRHLRADILETIENILYGSDGVLDVIDGLFSDTPSSDILDGGTASSSGSDLVDGSIEVIIGAPTNSRLPSLEELTSLVLWWNPTGINPEPVTGLSNLVAGGNDLTPTKPDGLYFTLPETRLASTAVEGIYQLT